MALPLSSLFLAAALFVGAAAPAPAQSQSPIHLIFDMHCDPLPNGLPLAQKQALYADWIANMNWVLDQTEPLGVPISFLSVGQFMELVVAEGAGGPGAAVLQRLYASGQMIGSHSHREYRAGAFDWPESPSSATYADSLRSWQDNIDWVNLAITLALGPSLPEPLSAINNVKGAHLPQTEPEYHAMMLHFGITVREGGAEEDYFQWYGHHIWNPFRPSAANYMGEDLSGPFVVPTQGSVIGLAQIHHGILQDMTAPAVKRQFLQLYLNWRYRDRMGLPEKTWSWGWGSHASDFDPADPSRPAILDVLPWLDLHFAHRVEPTGSRPLLFSTQRETAEDYEVWEAAHPGVSSFSFDSLTVNWDEYPYLRAVAEELEGFGWTADLTLAAGVEAYQLRKGPLDAVILWRDSGTSTLDLSALVGPLVRVVDLETGLLLGTDPAAVTVGNSPLIVTEEAPTLSVQGTPVLGATLNFTLRGPPATPAEIYLSRSPTLVDLPYIGQLQIATGAGLTLLGSGNTNPGGSFTASFTIPTNPSLIGVTGYFQGVVWLFDGQSPKLTVNSLALTVL